MFSIALFAAALVVAYGAAEPEIDYNPLNSTLPPLQQDDFVFVATSMLPRLPLLHATRAWRKGMRAVFVTDTPLERVPLHLIANSLRCVTRGCGSEARRIVPECGRWGVGGAAAEVGAPTSPISPHAHIPLPVLHL